MPLIYDNSILFYPDADYQIKAPTLVLPASNLLQALTQDGLLFEGSIAIKSTNELYLGSRPFTHLERVFPRVRQRDSIMLVDLLP